MNQTTTESGYSEYRTINKSLHDLLQVIFKHKGKILLVSFMVMSLSILWIVRLPRMYQSKAKILVKEGRENSILTTTTADIPGRIIDITRAEDINSEIEILHSRLLAERVVEKLGVDLKKPSDQASHPQGSSPSPVIQSLRKISHELGNVLSYYCPFVSSAQPSQVSFESAVLRIQRGLQVEKVKDSNVIQVSFSDPDPVVPVNVINALLDFYLDHHLMVYKTEGAYQFFSEQENYYHQKLRESEEKLEQFKQSWSLAELTLQRDILIHEIGDYENQLKRVEFEIDEVKERLLQQEEQIKNQEQKIWVSEINRSNPLVNQLRLQRSQLKLQEKKMISTYIDENHRKIQDIRLEIQEVDTQLKELENPIRDEVTTGINTIYQSLAASILKDKVELEALEVKKGNMKKHLSDLSQRMLELSDKEMELNQLERQILIDEESYRLYRKKMEENRISEAMDAARFANISIIEPALTPLEPLPNSKRLKAFMAVVLGLTSGLGVAFLCELMDHSVRNAEELESCLEIPVLGSVPDIKDSE